MNIETLNISLAQAAQKPTATPAETAEKLAEPRKIKKPVTAEVDVARVQEVDTQASQQRIALAEKIIGVNKSLVIERDSKSHGFVYKTIDRSTGEVTRIWPREEVLASLMSVQDADVRAAMRGMMIDAKA